MKMMRKVAVTLAAAALSVGVLGITAPAAHAPAHALDTNWPCAGCLKAPPSQR